MSGGPDFIDYGGLAPDQYRFFIWPTDGIHGAQWVGADGGTGDQDAAKVFQGKVGASGEVAIKLDGIGSITGVIRDRATREPAAACAYVIASGPRYEPSPLDLGCAVPDGTYTIPNLGPYTWKVQFVDYWGPHAWQWSGGEGGRHDASGIKVKAGTTATLNASLRPSGAIAGRVTLSNGGDPQQVLITAVNAETGDYAGLSVHPAADGTYTIAGGLTNEPVWLYFAPSQPDITIRYPFQIRTDYGKTLTGIDIAL